MNNNVKMEKLPSGALSITVPRIWVCPKEETRKMPIKQNHKPVAIYGIRKEI